MISSTWSQITQPEKSNPIMNSPMTALTSSPLIRNSSVSTSSSGLFKHQLSFQSSPPVPSSSSSNLAVDLSSTSSSSSDLTQKLSRDKSAMASPIVGETVAAADSKINSSTTDKLLFRLDSNSSSTSSTEKIG
jgi:hypothetical protein